MVKILVQEGRTGLHITRGVVYRIEVVPCADSVSFDARVSDRSLGPGPRTFVFPSPMISGVLELRLRHETYSVTSLFTRCI